MTAPSGRKEGDDWWQTALFQMEPNQTNNYKRRIRHASGN
jgi:hypothetical protein